MDTEETVNQCYLENSYLAIVRFSLLLLVTICLVTWSSKSAPPSDYLQNNMIANRIISSREGNVYVVKQETLFRMQRDEGDVWQRVAEDVQSASLDPQNDKIIYAATTSNLVMKSLDGGQRWISISNGLPRVKINFIFISPANSQEVFSGTEQGLYRTVDGGFSWEPTPLNSPVSQFYINPMSPANAYALTGSGSIVVSADSGRSWQKSESGLPTEVVRGTGRTAAKVTVKVTSLFFVGHRNTYLLAVAAGRGIFRSDDNGASWNEANTGLNPSDQFSTAYVGETGVVIAGTEIVQSRDGANWVPLPVKTIRLNPGSYEGIVRHPRKDGFLVLFRYAQDSNPASRIGYVGKGGALVGLSYGLMPRSDVLAVWPGRLNDRRTLFATVSDWTPTRRDSYYNIEEATYFSIDDGYSWEYLISSGCGTKVAVRPGDPKDLWMFGGGGACMLRADDGGLNWSKAPGTRFNASNDAVSKIAFDPVDKGLLYYCAGVNEHRVYRYKYNPASKEGQAVDLNVFAADIVVCEDNPKMIYAGVGQFSADGGWTWTDKSASLMKHIDRGCGSGGYRCRDLTLLSFRGNEIRIAVHRYDSFMHSGGFWIIRSSDLGDTWEVVSSFDEQQLTGIFLNPDDSKNMFAVVQVFVKERYSSKGDAIKVLETKDWGNTWREIYSYKLTKDDQYHKHEVVRAVSQFKMNNGRSILLGGRIGLWKSEDEGKSWTRLGGVQ